MELALGALASMGAGTAAAVPVVGAAGAMAVPTFGAAATGGLLGALGGASTGLGILGGLTTAVSAIQQYQQGQMKAEDAEIKSQIAKSEAIGARATGAQRSAAMKREILKTLGENDVAYAASGIDISYGEAATSRDRTIERGSNELAIDRATSDARASGFDAQATGFSRISRQYRSGAMLSALTTLGEGAMRFARRGVV